MSLSPGRALLLAALGYALVATVLFSRSFPADRLLVPMHTERLEPWRSDLSPERSSELAEGEFTSQSDKLLSFRPDDTITRQAFAERRLPLWNPTNAGGVPHLAQGLYGVFYPLHLAAQAVWSPERAYGFLAALHHFLAALFTFLFLRRIGTGTGGAFVAGLAFGFSSYLLMRVHYYQYVESLAWLPLGLYLIERWFERRSVVPLALLSLAAATVLLCGWPQTAVYTLYAWWILAVWRAAELDLRLGRHKLIGAFLLILAAATAVNIFLEPAERAWLYAFGPWAALLLAFSIAGGKGAFLRRLAWIGGALAVGGLIAAIQYLPAAEWNEHANRGGLGAPDQQIALGLKPTFLLDLGLHGLFGAPSFSHLESPFHLARLLAAGDPAVAGRAGNLVEITSYCGLLTVLLAVAGACFGAFRRGFLTLLLLLYGGFALGLTAMVLPLFVGGFFVGADPRRALGVALFSLCCLGGLGLTGLLKGQGRRLLRTLTILLLLAAAAALGVGLLAGDDTLLGPLLARVRELLEAFSVAGQPLPEIPADALTANADALRHALVRFGWIGLLSGGALLLLGSRLRGSVAPLAVAAVLAIDLCLAGWPLSSTQPASGFLSGHPLISHLQQTTGKQGRIYRYTAPDTVSALHVALPPNLAGCYGLLDANCYTVAPPKRWMELAERIDPQWVHDGGVFMQPLTRPEQLSSRVLDLMAVRSIVGFGEPPQQLPTGIELEARFGRSFVLENERALPRLFTVGSIEDASTYGPEKTLNRLLARTFEPRSRVLLEGPELPDDSGYDPEKLPAAILERDDAERIEVRLEGGGSGGILVLLDSWAPGWSATVDGREAPVLVADFAFRGIPFGPGSQRIELIYSPRSVAIGRLLSLFGLILVGGFLLFGLLRRPTGGAEMDASPAPQE